MAVPKLRFKTDDGSDYPDLVEIKIGDAIKEAKRPLDMKDDEKYQLVTVKRRNEGIVSRGMFYGKDILVKNYYTVKKGDYIISKRQVIHGANGIVPPELDDAIVSNEYMVLSDSKALLAEYLALYSMTKKMYHMFFISSYGVDIEKMFFNVDDWKKKKIMAPCIKEQQKVVELFSLIDTVIEKQKETVSVWEERKKGVMQKLFSQKVRFKADDGSDFPDWEKKKLEDVVEFLDGQRKPLEAGQRVSGKYPYYGASGIIDYVENYIFDEELILLSEDGANILDRNYRVCFLAKGKYWVNNHAHVLRAMDGNVNGFICEQLESFDYRKYNSGGAQPKLNQATCRAIIMNIPCLEEQQKIADCLSSLDEVIEKQKATLAEWEELKKGLLQQMFV